MKFWNLTNSDIEIYHRQEKEYKKIQDWHNIVFLDVDGVLNHAGCKETTPQGYTGVLDEPIAVLSEIVHENDALVVLCSSWKSEWQREIPRDGFADSDGLYLMHHLAAHDIYIADKTDDQSYDRGKGIIDWLNSHQHKGWIVLDDEVFGDYKAYKITRHLIQTSFYKAKGGLREKHKKQAAIIFTRQQE